MRIPLTPEVNLAGLFTANNPYEFPSNVVFKLEAIRTFPELVRDGEDVYLKYYEPKGLSRQDYLDDADVKAAILTFKSTDGEVRYVPNTFLADYPGQNSIAYTRNVYVFDLGLTPSYVDAGKLNDDIVALIKSQVGVETTGELTIMQYEGTVTEEDHIKMEARRKATIRQSAPLTEQLAAATQRANELQVMNDNMLKIIKDAGLTN